MNDDATSLDVSRLERVRYSCDKFTSRCPACAEMERDRKGNNLAVFPTGAFHCQAFPGDKEHNARIFALAGGLRGRKPDLKDRQVWRERRAQELRAAHLRAEVLTNARAQRGKIIARHPWGLADVMEDSPQRIDSRIVEFDPRHFLGSLFPHHAIVWTGDVRHSGTRHADRWRTVEEWQAETEVERVGPMATPAVWLPGTTSRSRNNVESAPFTVLDFDGFDGEKPRTPLELERHIRDSLAIVRWIRQGLEWELSALLWTGGKSIHAWFRTPPPRVLQSLRTAATAFGLDEGLIGHPEHPCRLPGHRHATTGKSSRVLWLNCL
jgi:hypothetical protein